LGHYYGHWENGEKHGEGVMIYVNKDIYSGQWKFGNKDGKGTYIFADTGMKFVGNFKSGNFTVG
jgi:radial spoke head protein 1